VPSKVLAFDAVPAERTGQASVTYWSGVPLGINDYDGARGEIVRRIDDLLPTLTADQGTAVTAGHLDMGRTMQRLARMITHRVLRFEIRSRTGIIDPVPCCCSVPDRDFRNSSVVAALKDDQDPIADRRSGPALERSLSRPETACDNVARRDHSIKARRATT
jgi:hypothetical protein